MQEEVCRLFRGNCFNKSKREYEQKNSEEKYPILKEDLGKNLDLRDTARRNVFIEKMKERVSIPK